MENWVIKFLFNATNIQEPTVFKSKVVHTWTEVEVLNHIEALHKYKTDVLFLSWPSFDKSYAFKSLTIFGGQYVIYIGEGEHGCTADDDFHNLLDKEWKLLEQIEITNWDCIHDSIFLYSRKYK